MFGHFPCFVIFILVTEATLTDLFYLILKQLNTRIIWMQILSKSFQLLLSISSFVQLSATPDGGHLEMLNCEKSRWLYAIIILAQSWVNFNKWFLRYCHFHVYAIFSYGLTKFYNSETQDLGHT